jgi:chemotaxis protein methyltransferase CheR
MKDVKQRDARRRKPCAARCGDDLAGGCAAAGDGGFAFRLMTISDDEFDLIRNLVYKQFGIALTPVKKSLVVGRLQKTLRLLGFSSFGQFYEHVVNDASGAALDALVNQISTNHTFFYREAAHFAFFRQKALPEITRRLQQENKRDIRLWCAGCSSGEEAYTIMMEMLEHFADSYRLWDAGLLATDISAKALAKAAAAVYPDENVSNVPAAAMRYFKRNSSGAWEVSSAVKQEVTFRRFNLMNETFPFKKPFHAIFCRNVMIYFDQPTRQELVGKFYASLVPGGYLFIGHSESLGRDQELFEYVMPAVYRRRSSLL